MDVLHSPIPLTRVSLLEDRTDLMSTYKEPPFPATSLFAMKPPSIIYPAYYSPQIQCRSYLAVEFRIDVHCIP